MDFSQVDPSYELFSEKPKWAYPDYCLMSLIHKTDQFRMFFLENLDHNYDALPFFTKKDYLIVTIGCFFEDYNFALNRYILESNKFDIDPQKVIFLCNYYDQVLLAKKWGFSAILFNQNALINQDVFKINETINKEYKLVLNTRPDTIKRPWLASGVTDLAILQGYNYFQDRFWDLNQLNPKYINQERLQPSQVNDILNASYVGGIFSEKEGANYATGEYLLAGIPVVSTRSTGGREVWLNDYNSITIDPNEQDVSKAVEQLIARIQSGEIDAKKIRDDFISMTNYFKNNLRELIHDIAGTYMLSEVDAKEIFYKLVHEKIQKNMNTSYGTELLMEDKNKKLLFSEHNLPNIVIYDQNGIPSNFSKSDLNFIFPITEKINTLFDGTDVVAIVAPISTNLISAWFACLRSKKIPILVQNYHKKQHRNSWELSVIASLKAARATCVILQNQRDYFEGLSGCKIIYLDDISLTNFNDAEKFSNEVEIAFDSSFLQLSSGTTGQRKPVLFSIESVLNHLNDYDNIMKYDNSDVIVSWLPLYHDMGFIACFLCSLLKPTKLVLIDPIRWVESPSYLFDLIEKYSGTLVYMPNFGYEVMSRAPTLRNITTVRKWISCSEPIYIETVEKFLNLHNISKNNFSACYAMAENIFAVTQSDAFEYIEVNGKNYVSCGKPISNVSVRVDDEQIWIKSPISMKSYYQGDAITDKDGYYLSGDCGFFNNDSLYITGRDSDLVIIAGVKYFLNDIDNLINQYDDGIKGRVCSIYDYDEGLGLEKIVVLIEDQFFYQKEDEPLLSYIKNISGINQVNINYVPPKFITKTSSGKINRKKTRFDWLAVGEWKKISSKISVRTPKELIQSSFIGIDFSLPIGEALDSLGILMLTVILGSNNQEIDLNATLDEYSSAFKDDIKLSKNSEKIVNIVYIGDAGIPINFEKFLNKVVHKISCSLEIEQIVTPPSGVLLNDVIFFDYFLPRYFGTDKLQYFQAWMEIIKKIKSANLILTDDIVEFGLNSDQNYLMLSHDCMRHDNADLVVFRPYKYLSNHEKLPARSVNPGNELLDPNTTLKLLSEYLEVPVTGLAATEFWPEQTSSWLIHNIPYMTSYEHWHFSENTFVDGLCKVLEAIGFCALDEKIPPIEKSYKVIYDGLGHMCSQEVIMEKINSLVHEYDRFLIIGPAASLPYIKKRITALGKTYIHSWMNDFQKDGISELDFDVIIQAGSWGRPASSKPIYQIISAGWEDQILKYQKSVKYFYTE